MTNSSNLVPKIKSVNISTNTDEIPEITEIHYDVLTLSVTLAFEKIEKPMFVVFNGVSGFRVLDEGNLLEFWNPCRQRAEGANGKRPLRFIVDRLTSKWLDSLVKRRLKANGDPHSWKN